MTDRKPRDAFFDRDTAGIASHEALSRTGAVKVQEAIDNITDITLRHIAESKDVTACRERIRAAVIINLSALEPAAPEGQQPVAWRYYRHDGTSFVTVDDYADWQRAYPSREPLYTRPSEQAVTEAMVARALDLIEEKLCIIWAAPGSRDEFSNALKAAMEAGR